MAATELIVEKFYNIFKRAETLEYFFKTGVSIKTKIKIRVHCSEKRAKKKINLKNKLPITCTRILMTLFAAVTDNIYFSFSTDFRVLAPSRH